MILVNRIEDTIVVSCNGEEYTTNYSKQAFDDLMSLADTSEGIQKIEELDPLLEKVKEICSKESEKWINDLHEDLFKNFKTGKYHLRIKKDKDGDIISSVPMPQALVRRIEESIDKKINISPLLKNWMLFLRNKKANNADFANKYFNYIDMTYVMPDKKQEYLDAGYSEELATQLATTYQVKITNEGLINCYKVSKEVDWKFVSDEDGNPKRVNLYEKTFDPITGEIVGDSREDLKAEDRSFIPSMMRTSGDAFYCEGAKGSGKLGHEIRVGAVHRLPDWSFVDCNDYRSCVKGLHVGGLYYIANYSGEIHNVFVDPMHIGAIPNDNTGAIRCLQYFVHSSMVAVNDSIYHSSTYAEKTNEQWEDIKKEILKNYGELKEKMSEDKDEINAL